MQKIHSTDVKTRILSWFSTAKKVVETLVVVVGVNIDADQTGACVNMCVCVWLEGQCCTFPFSLLSDLQF